ncbi:MAG: tetratricopeptide repeat protein [Desulfomonile tiedjei]|uniref:Tetratricopeptide repeat protein n=1 Tax=Desulfomonile tiedjei TaxID=2358 RepID=A0A9D6V7Z4_9BACT|nr:tetratricopeptide repeat protein [Desulfomonile tiedjei]
MIFKIINCRLCCACCLTVAIYILPCCGLICTASAASNDFEKGLAAARSGQMDLAITLWTKMIERHPKSYEAHVNRGKAYIYMGRVFKGVTDWHRARELAPVFAYGVYSGDFIRASSDGKLLSFVAPLELDPDYLPSVFMTAVTYLDVGRTDRALELYRKSIDLTTNPLLKSYFDHWAGSIESDPKE